MDLRSASFRMSRWARKRSRSSGASPGGNSAAPASAACARRPRRCLRASGAHLPRAPPRSGPSARASCRRGHPKRRRARFRGADAGRARSAGRRHGHAVPETGAGRIGRAGGRALKRRLGRRPVDPARRGSGDLCRLVRGAAVGLTLVAPTAFHASYVRTHYTDRLVRALVRAGGMPGELRIVAPGV